MHFSFHFPALPKVGMRIFKTLGAVLLVVRHTGCWAGATLLRLHQRSVRHGQLSGAEACALAATVCSCWAAGG